MKINTLVSNVIAICFFILVFVIALIWIAFHFNDSTAAFKDSLSIGASFFSAIATLAAAYIASKLFNDWKAQHNKNIEAQFATEIMNLTCESNFQLLQLLNTIERLVQNIDEKNVENFKVAFQDLTIVRDTLVGIICPKVNLIVSPNDYKNHFFPLIDQITTKLEIFLQSMHKCIKGEIYKNDPSYNTYLNDIAINTADLKRQFDQIFLMLKPYVKVNEDH